jgi:hypothetical protein
MSLLPVGIGSEEGGYRIERSLRFNSADSANLTRTFSSAGNRKTWTWSGWVKLGLISNDRCLFSAQASATAINLGSYISPYTLVVDGTYDGTRHLRHTSAIFRDPSAWYHIVVALDTTQATDTNRVKVYVNGVQVSLTTAAVGSWPAQNSDGSINNNIQHCVGQRINTTDYNYDGYLTEVNFIDGQALTPTDFGEFNSDTGVWQPIKYTGTYGTNGFYLNFSDNASTSALGDDFSGNGNDWTTNNFSVTAGAGNDSLVDSPTRYGTDTGAGGEVRGNYAVMNPNAISQNTSGVLTLSNGNLTASFGSGGYGGTSSTIAVSSGKYYAEFVLTSSSSTNDATVGIKNITAINASFWYPGGNANTYGYYGDGRKQNNDSYSLYGSSYTTNDVIGVALDMDAGTVTFYKNNVSQGTAFSSLSGSFVFSVGDGATPTTQTWECNFGARPFAYTAPSGFKALVTTNLPAPTIEDGGDYFNAILYTGTGSSNARTGVGFQPDLVWIKERNGAADHALYDAVRGVQQQLESNTTTDETTESTGLTAFGSDGFTVGSLAQVNTNNDTYVAWCWKESTTSKFDIVTYTGNGTARTISHNLGVVPNMIIVKARTTASTDQGWPIYHSANTSAPATDYLLLNTTAATADLDTVWNDTAPTSSVFSVGTNALVNANNDTYVAYLFANVAGYSAFGSYTGNGSADGPFVYTGFRPAFVMWKRTDTSGNNWVIQDNKRSAPYNPADGEILPSSSAAESTVESKLDLLSNGFKIRTTNAGENASGGTYIYAAFAENPFSIALAR